MSCLCKELCTPLTQSFHTSPIWQMIQECEIKDHQIMKQFLSPGHRGCEHLTCNGPPSYHHNTSFCTDKHLIREVVLESAPPTHLILLFHEMAARTLLTRHCTVPQLYKCTSVIHRIFHSVPSI